MDVAETLDPRTAVRELVPDRIVGYLHERVERRATAQCSARLVNAARIEGIDLAGAQAMRVNGAEPRPVGEGVSILGAQN